ncbi:hypothetical protein TNCV_240671 [Trichonephila clavipes]|nr:hypothetical protein TNCV_240671 [Trichonephila clavipes]
MLLRLTVKSFDVEVSGKNVYTSKVSKHAFLALKVGETVRFRDGAVEIEEIEVLPLSERVVSVAVEGPGAASENVFAEEFYSPLAVRNSFLIIGVNL